MKPTLSSIREVLARHTPGLTVEALDATLDRKLFELVESRIKELIMAQLSSLTLGELISLHKELVTPVVPIVGFKPEEKKIEEKAKAIPKPSVKRGKKNSKGW